MLSFLNMIILYWIILTASHVGQAVGQGHVNPAMECPDVICTVFVPEGCEVQTYFYMDGIPCEGCARNRCDEDAPPPPSCPRLLCEGDPIPAGCQQDHFFKNRDGIVCKGCLINGCMFGGTQSSQGSAQVTHLKQTGHRGTSFVNGGGQIGHQGTSFVSGGALSNTNSQQQFTNTGGLTNNQMFSRSVGMNSNNKLAIQAPIHQLHSFGNQIGTVRPGSIGTREISLSNAVTPSRQHHASIPASNGVEFLELPRNVNSSFVDSLMTNATAIDLMWKTRTNAIQSLPNTAHNRQTRISNNVFGTNMFSSSVPTPSVFPNAAQLGHIRTGNDAWLQTNLRATVQQNQHPRFVNGRHIRPEIKFLTPTTFRTSTKNAATSLSNLQGGIQGAHLGQIGHQGTSFVSGGALSNTKSQQQFTNTGGLTNNQMFSGSVGMNSNNKLAIQAPFDQVHSFGNQFRTVRPDSFGKRRNSLSNAVTPSRQHHSSIPASNGVEFLELPRNVNSSFVDSLLTNATVIDSIWKTRTNPIQSLPNTVHNSQTRFSNNVFGTNMISSSVQAPSVFPSTAQLGHVRTGNDAWLQTNFRAPVQQNQHPRFVNGRHIRPVINLLTPTTFRTLDKNAATSLSNVASRHLNRPLLTNRPLIFPGLFKNKNSHQKHIENPPFIQKRVPLSNVNTFQSLTKTNVILPQILRNSSATSNDQLPLQHRTTNGKPVNRHGTLHVLSNIAQENLNLAPGSRAPSNLASIKLALFKVSPSNTVHNPTTLGTFLPQNTHLLGIVPETHVPPSGSRSHVHILKSINDLTIQKLSQLPRVHNTQGIFFVNVERPSILSSSFPPRQVEDFPMPSFMYNPYSM